MGDSEFKIILKFVDNASKSAEQALNTVKKNVGSVATMASQAGAQLQSLGRTIVSFGAVGAGALLAIGGQALSTANQFEQMGASLVTTFQGNEQAAKDAQKTITTFATKTPYQLNEVLNAFIKLKNYGLDPSQKALSAYGDIASSMGKGLNDMIEAVADASTLEFERLKEFGIRASQEKDRVIFTFRGVKTAVGKDAQSIQNYLIKLGETNFAGAMIRQSKTLGGVISNLQDQVSASLNEISVSSGLLDVAKDYAIGFTKALADATPMLLNYSKGLIDIAKGFTGLAQAIAYAIETGDTSNGVFGKLAEKFPAMSGAIYGFQKALQKAIDFISKNRGLLKESAKIFVALSVAIGGLAVVSLIINPITLAVGALMALSVAVAYLKDAWENNFMDIQGQVARLVRSILDLRDRFIAFIQHPMVQLFLQTMRELGTQILVKLNDSFNQVMVVLGPFIQTLIELWNKLEPVRNVIAIIAGTLLGLFVVGIMKLVEVVAGILGPTLSWIIGILNSVARATIWAIDAVGNFGSRAWQVAQAVGSAFGAMANVVKGAINNVIGQINTAFIMVNNWIRVIRSIPTLGSVIPNISIPQIPRLSRGGDFIVPPGFENDNFPIMVQSGERVQVTPANQVTNNSKGINIENINVYNNDDFARLQHLLNMALS